MNAFPSRSSIPAVFIGHGSPMNTLDNNKYTRAWRDLAASIPTPRAILAISAHWYVNATAVTAMQEPKVIHDFYGFPDELFRFNYPAMGSPELAREVVDLVRPTWVGEDVDSWGIDHGTWSVLAHMYPEANVPVVQLSIDATKSFDEHVAIGAALAPLCDSGVLVLGSGNVVHNLRRLDWSSPDGAFDWTVEFDENARRVMTTSPSDIAALADDDRFSLAVPTPDHFIPLLYVAGVARARGTAARPFVEGYSMGSLSMTSYVVPTDD